MVTLRLDTWFWVAKRSVPNSRLAVPAVLAAVVERRVCEGCHGGGQGRDVAGELDCRRKLNTDPSVATEI